VDADALHRQHGRVGGRNTVIGSRVGRLAPTAVNAARRARSQLAGWAAPQLERELRAVRRELADTQATLHDVRAELRQARDRLDETSHKLPDELEETIAGVRKEHLTYLKPAYLRALAGAVIDAEREGLPGLILEAGTALGGSAIVMAAAKSPDRPMKVYDVFGMIPPPTDKDGADVHDRYRKITAGDARGVGGEVYYGYREDLKGEVTASFARHGVPVDERGVELVEGLFEDTIHIDEPVAVAHLDGDWYESTKTCLERIAPHVVPGGRIIFDDYYKWSGCRTAVDEYFSAHEGFQLEHGAKLHAVRR
jgi:O-methyltransferase